MGAGVVKAPADGKSKNTSNRSTNRPVIGEMACAACSKEFTILRRKKQCCECGCYHCSSCVLKDATSTLRTPPRRCRKCLRLLSGNFTRNDLAVFKVKDLQNFLRRRDVSLRNCKEKHDLIDLVLSYSSSSQHHLEQEQYRERLLELQRRKREAEEVSSNEASQSDTSASMHSSPSLSQRNSPRITSHRGHQMPPPEPTPVAHTSSTGPQAQAAQNDLSENSTAVPNNENSSAAAVAEPEAEPMQAKAAKRAKLSDIPNEEYIESLTVRQLKELLATNYVDYKGCCEKWELINRVKRLWKQKTTNDELAVELEATEEVAVAQGASSGESDICKVCMDAVIDCVLLECGHMVSCTKCGRQLAECPICRQYVIRVVHTFKA